MIGKGKGNEIGSWRNPTQHCGGQGEEEGSEPESRVREEEVTKKVPHHPAKEQLFLFTRDLKNAFADLRASSGLLSETREAGRLLSSHLDIQLPITSAGKRGTERGVRDICVSSQPFLSGLVALRLLFVVLSLTICQVQ